MGGESGFSDNIPQTLPTGMSYREQWTGIPAIGEATRAVLHRVGRLMPQPSRTDPADD
ncbi:MULTISPECIES: hypothetical protein [unclassified Streptomyces]|uniref:hypothetical protein n=1 Tax=unclassified Streptomyces TaxID=2593676 RepID=UPI0013CCC553|nr:hypothetical protein [Streptomyces sp. SID10362]NDZ70716.1 hypothetical protein [Streptomyces sp. SID10362]